MFYYFFLSVHILLVSIPANAKVSELKIRQAETQEKSNSSKHLQVASLYTDNVASNFDLGKLPLTNDIYGYYLPTGNNIYNYPGTNNAYSPDQSQGSYNNLDGYYFSYPGNNWPQTDQNKFPITTQGQTNYPDYANTNGAVDLPGFDVPSIQDNGFFGPDVGNPAVPYDVLERAQGYELRRYPASKLACTIIENPDTGLNSWQAPATAWQAPDPTNLNAFYGPSSPQFSPDRTNEKAQALKRLQRYVSGLSVDPNSPWPVLTKYNPGARFSKFDTENQEICIFIGTSLGGASRPSRPFASGSIYTQDKDGMDIFVRPIQFAQAPDDLDSSVTRFISDLGGRADIDNSGIYYLAEYKTGNQRQNEIWLPRKNQPRMPQFGFGQGTPTFGSNQNNFANGIGNPTADEVLSVLPFYPLQNGNNYDLRRIPAAKWICTQIQNYDPVNDPINNWRRMFNGNPQMAIESVNFQESGFQRMFKKLQKYFLGLNAAFVELNQTMPVVLKHKAGPRGYQREDLEMCLWPGDGWDYQQLPKPILGDVYIQNKPQFNVYARKFGGFALSSNDMRQELEALKSDLSGKNIDRNNYYTVTYNNPWTTSRRKNEIWIETI